MGALRRSSATGRILRDPATGKRKRCGCCAPTYSGLCCGSPRFSPCTWEQVDPLCDPETSDCLYSIAYTNDLEYDLEWANRIDNPNIIWRDATTSSWNKIHQFERSDNTCGSFVQFPFADRILRYVNDDTDTHLSVIQHYHQRTSITLGSTYEAVVDPAPLRTGPLSHLLPTLRWESIVWMGWGEFNIALLNIAGAASMQDGSLSIDVGVGGDDGTELDPASSVSVSGGITGTGPCMTQVNVTVTIDARIRDPINHNAISSAAGTVSLSIGVTGIHECPGPEDDGGAELAPL